MSTSAEDLQKMLDWAKENNDQEAVDAVTQRMSQSQGAPEPEPAGALSAPVTAEAQPTATGGALGGDTPSLETPGALATEDRARVKAQTQYDADQQRIRQQQQENPVSSEEFRQFLRENEDWEYGSSPVDGMQRQVVRDPESGTLRWSALSPDQMEWMKNDKERGLTAIVNAAPGVLTSVVVDQVGNSMARMDENEKSLKAMQGVLWDQMSDAERTRFREEGARIRTSQGEARLYTADDMTDDMFINKIPPQMFKEILDGNPEARDELFGKIEGDEKDVSWGERFKRLGTKIMSLRDPYGMSEAINMFGAEDPGGDLLGFGQFQGLDAKYEREGKDRPAFPGASRVLDEWLDTAEREGATMGQVYREVFGKPFEMIAKEHFGSDKGAGELIHVGAEKMREISMTEELMKSRNKPMFPEGASFDDIGKSETWVNDETALPWNDLAGFSMKAIEQMPYFLESMLPARAAGRMGARYATKEFAGRSITEIEKFRKRYATMGGAIGGGASEGAMIYDQVYSETLGAVSEIPIERLREDPQFLALLGSGMTEEEAKQMLAQDAARSAGKAGFVFSALVLGTPMGMLYGQGAAGTLLRKNQALRVGGALLGEPVQESLQEGTEGEVSDIQIGKIDPNNPIFSDEGRRLERMGSGFMLGTGTAIPSAVGALSPDDPVGYEKEDVQAARKTETYMEARDARFKLEFLVSDPTYIRTTPPLERLHDMQKLEKLQSAEADAIIGMQAEVREHLMKNGPTMTAQAELKMLDSLVMSANAMKSDIAVARSRRQSAGEMAAEQQVIMEERVQIQERVNESLIKLEDIDRIAGNIEKIQKFETVDDAGMSELVQEGYVKKNKDGTAAVLPKGKRAIKELMRQRRGVEGRLETGYVGAERRNQENLIEREVIENAGPVDREAMLYEDSLTGAGNRRAFNDRVQNIDEKDESKRTESQAPAVAAVDVDSLKWVNDKMGEHAAGDQLLLTISDALGRQEGLTVYRIGGDEFVVTGESEAAIEEAMQAARAELQETPISTREDQVLPQITWATGKDYAAADKAAVAMKNERKERGKITNKKTGKPTTYSVKKQGSLFQKTTEFESARAAAAQERSNARMTLMDLIEKRDKADAKAKAAVEQERAYLDKGEEVPTKIVEKTDELWEAHEAATQAVIEHMTMEERDSKAREENLKKLEEAAPAMPNKWADVREDIQRGDTIEILTPDGATFGVVTNVSNRRGRPRVKVTVQGRTFTFNPKGNWLVVAPNTKPSDVAWITGDAKYAEKGRETLPQTIDGVQIGHIGRGGNFYADLGPDNAPATPAPRPKNLYPKYIYKTGQMNGFFGKQHLPSATKAEMREAMGVLDLLTKGANNLPKITMVTDLEKRAGVDKDGNPVKIPDVVFDQIKAEGANITGVKGYFDHVNTDNGLFIFVPNIHGGADSTFFKQSIAETVLHELIGHYGVRGIFGDEQALRVEMHRIVDAFPRLAKHYAKQLGNLDLSLAHDKQLVGEEMIAYMAGKVLSGKEDFTPKQKSAWQRLLQWFRTVLVNRGWNRFSPVKKLVTGIDNSMTLDQSKEMFWNDTKIQELIWRSQDFVMQGPSFEFRAINDDSIRYMRDADIFQAGLLSSINATRPVTGSERKQLAQKYGGKENVPKELPIIPDSGSPNVYRTALLNAQKAKMLTSRELELSNLGDKGEFSFLRDTTYADIKGLLVPEGGTFNRNWYVGIVPPAIENELNAAYAAIDSFVMVGPLHSNYMDRPTSEDYRTNRNAAATEAAQNHIAEILSQKINQKKTTLTKEILTNYMRQSNNVMRVTVERATGHQTLSYEQAAIKLFGDNYDADNISVMGKDMIKREVEESGRKGPDIGYNEEQQLWIDSTSRETEMARYSPAGNRADNDYRIVLIKTAGSGREMEISHQHFSPNLMHLRTGVADFLATGDGQIIPTADNPANIDKFLAMIELQSDWLQHLRKGYTSRKDRDAAASQQDTDIATLKGVSQRFVNDIAGNLWSEVDRLLKPALEMSDSEEWARDKNELSQQKYGMPWDNLSTNDQVLLWQEEIAKRTDAVVGLFETAITNLDAVMNSFPSIGDGIVGTMDARAFDRLDKAAAKEVGSHLRTSLDQAKSIIRDLAAGINNQSGLEQRAEGFKGDFMSYFKRQARANSASSTMRMGLIGHELRDMITPVYKALGIEMNGLTDAIEKMKEQSALSVRIPSDTFIDLSTATESGQSALWWATEIFSSGNLIDNGIQPQTIGLTINERTPGFIELKLSGDKGALTNFNDKLPGIIAKSVTDRGPSTYDAVQRRKAERESEVNRTNPEFHDVEEYFDWSEIDVEDTDLSNDDLNTLREHNVMTFERFEEDHLSDALDDAVRDHMHNMDWDNTDYNRDSEEYRTQIIVDEDGDADTSEAEAWLTEGREEYESDMRNDDSIYDEARDNVRQRWESDDIPFFGTGQLPVQWDFATGEATSWVDLYITAEEPGGEHSIYIDGSKTDYQWAPDDAKEDLAKTAGDYYRDHGILPPPETPYNNNLPPEPTTETAVETAKPNWDIVASNIVSATEAMSGNAIKTEQVFRRMVKFRANSDSGGHGIFRDSPLSGDKEWRTIALRYLLSDAVRRGMPGIVWSEGLSSGKRGGNWGMSTLTRVDKVTWKKEVMTLQGEEKDVIVISSPSLSDPIVVAPDKMLPVLGTKLTSHIYQQMNGKIPVAPALVAPTEGEQGVLFEGQSVNPRNHFLVSQTSGGLLAIHNRDDNDFVGFAKSEEDADRIMQNAFQNLPVAQTLTGNMESSELFGEAFSSGIVTADSFGGQMNLVVGEYTDHYAHTFTQPRTASARESYEGITISIWNNELKKYGAKVGRTTIKVDDVEQAIHEEGISVTRIKAREKKVAEKHGSLTIEELTGESHGWVVMSANHGPVYERVFASRSAADRQLEDYITEQFGNDEGGSEVFYIEINDKIKEEFSGPVAPFHYDPSEDPDLKDMAERFGGNVPRKPFMERWAAFKDDVNASWQQGLFDSFYGIKRAMQNAGVHVNAANDPYIQARMSTSLDSVMKGALLFGHPVWKDGIIQNEGKGLAEILQPIMSDTKPWEMYMYAKRAKGLMLEAFTTVRDNPGKYKTPALEKYNGLDWNDVQKIQQAARHFPGKTENDQVFALFAWKARREGESKNGVSRREAIKMIASAGISAKKNMAAGSAEAEKIYDIVEKSLRVGRSNTAKYKATLAGAAEKRAAWALGEIKKLTGMGDSEAQSAIKKAKSLIKQARDAEAASKLAAQLKSDIDKGVEWANKVLGGGADKDKAAHAKSDIHGVLGMGAIDRAVQGGRERRFDAAQLQDSIKLNDKFPQFERVAKDWAVYNKAVLDLAEAAGTINKESRAIWENADYVPFHSLDIESSKGIAGGQGVANVKSQIQRLTGNPEGDLDIIHNIMTKTTTMIEGAMKNHAALLAIDALKGSGSVSKAAKQITSEMIPMSQLKEHFTKIGVDPSTVPPAMFEGIRKMMSVNPPSGDNVLSVLRNGKREYWETNDPILFRAMTALNKEVWDNPAMTVARGTKRFFTSWITLDPGFMARNFARDTGGAFILSRDNMIPIASAIKGFKQALVQDEAYRVMLGSGAAFENGFVTASDPKQTKKILKRAMRSTGFVATVLDSPRKLFDAYKALSSAIENANRIAVYNAAIRAGKSKAQAAFEAKDLMDFTMGGDWPAVQFLIQTVPFIGARMQGLHRLGRGFVENPAGFTLKASLLTMASLAVWFAFRDDERYKELEDWDKDTYIHWWVGDAHYRLPKPFEIGALFMTVPERMAEYMYSNETDAGRLLLKRMGHMFHQTFAMSPFPQAVSPIIEMGFNHDMFRGRDIVNYFEEQKLPPEQRRHWTSPTMAWLGENLPKELDTVSMKIRSPLHLQHFYEGYTATIGKYVLMASDAVVRSQLDMPLPPSKDISDWPGISSFYRGENQYRKTKYEEEVWDLLRKTTMIQGSLNFHEKNGDVDAYLRTHEDYVPYVKAASSLEGVREDLSDINRAQMQIYVDPNMSRDEKKVEDDKLQKIKNELMKEAFELRPGGAYNPLGEPVSQENILNLIDEFGVDDSAAYDRRLREDAPATHELLQMIDGNINRRGLQSLAKVQANVE